MAKLIFSTADRDESHRMLDEFRAGDYPDAECREDANLEEPYQVWSGPEV